MSKFKLILTYIDSNEKADEIAKKLVEEKLVACVGIWPCRSVYWWQGKIEKNENELIMQFKAKESLVDEIIKRIKELHSYDLPVIDVIDTVLDKEAGKWLDEVTK